MHQRKVAFINANHSSHCTASHHLDGCSEVSDEWCSTIIALVSLSYWLMSVCYTDTRPMVVLLPIHSHKFSVVRLFVPERFTSLSVLALYCDFLHWSGV